MSERLSVTRLGSGKIGSLLWEMSSQTTLALAVYAIYSITDTYFLSVGINSLAAAGSSIISPVLIALGGVSTTVGAGGASLVSRALGEQNPQKASRTVANTFLIFWTVALLITIVGASFIKQIVYFLGATETIAPYAVTYGRIIFLGALTSTGYSTIVRADGNVRFSTAMWIIPVCTNLFLCWLLIMVLHMGVEGAAIATVAGQSVSSGMSIYFFFFRKHRSYDLKLDYFKPDWSLIREIVLIGLPSFFKSFGSSVFVIVTNNLLRASGGDAALGVFAIVGRLYSGLTTPQTGIVQGMQPIVGYNFGQKKFDRIRKTIRLSIASSVAYGVLICILCLAIPGVMLGVLSKETAIVLEGQSALRLFALACPIGGVSVLVAAFFQATGRTREAFALTLGGILVVKLPVLLVAARLFSLTGIWLSEAVSETILCVISLWWLKRIQDRFEKSTLTPAAVQPPAEPE